MPIRYPPVLGIACLALVAGPVAAFSPGPPETPSAPLPAAAAEPDRPSSALASLSPGARSLVSRRARFVYRLPDGSIWDGYWYGEFRAALADFDSSTTWTRMPVRPKAWGFQWGKRWPSAKDRPDKLWTSVQHPTAVHTPFIYLNPGAATSLERNKRPHAEVVKEVRGGFFQVRVTEFPGDDFGRLPKSIAYGAANVTVLFPPAVSVRVGDSLRGEFFLVHDSSIPAPRNHPGQFHAYRYIPAQQMRLDAEQYAAALLARQAEMIDWTWKRDTSLGDGGYIWTRQVIDIGSMVQDVPETTADADESGETAAEEPE